jgi:hypothetical protein
MLAIFQRFWRRGNDTESNVVGGSDAVLQAILEKTNDEQRYVVFLGEPELVDRGGEFQSQYNVRIPTSTEPGQPEPPDVEYDLPGEGMEEGENDLFDLLEVYNIESVSNLDQLEGETVFGCIEGGAMTLRFDQMESESGE